MKLNDKDRERPVRTVIVVTHVTRALLDDLAPLGILHHDTPVVRGEFRAFEKEVPLGRLAEAIRQGVLGNPACVGAALFLEPADRGTPLLQKVDERAGIRKVLTHLTATKVAAGLDVQWGEAVNDRIPQKGREVAVAA